MEAYLTVAIGTALFCLLFFILAGVVDNREMARAMAWGMVIALFWPIFVVILLIYGLINGVKLLAKPLDNVTS